MGSSAYCEGKEIPEFDNFNTDYPFTYKGKTWQCAEALYQACKFKDKKYREEIRKAPIEAVWGMGHSRDHEVVDNFFKKRHRIMYLVNHIRINQHAKLQELLLSTKGRITFPGSDEYWGTNWGEKGANWNGVNLMIIRDTLREKRKMKKI